MQVSVEATGNISRKMTIELPSDQIDRALNKQLQSMRANVKLDGFRPGKVPLKIVKQRYGSSVFGEVVDKMLPSSFMQAATQEALNVATSPQFEFSQFEWGKNVEYTATFEIYPIFSIAPVDSVQISRPTAQITEQDIDKMVENLREQQKTWKIVDRPAAKADQVKIDFVGILEGKSFEGGTAENVEVILGEGRMLADFEAAIIGLSAGEEKVVDVPFPDDYEVVDLRGKTAQFTVKPSQVSETDLPVVDEAFMSKFGVDNGSLQDFRHNVNNNMQRQLDRAIRQNLKAQVMDGLSHLHEIDLPTGLVDAEIKQLREEIQQSSRMQSNNEQFDGLPDDIFRPRAAERVKLGLIVGEFVKQKELKQDDQSVEARLKEEVAEYENPEEAFTHFQKDEKTMTHIRAAVLEDKVVDCVMESAQVTDSPMSFYEVLNASNANAENQQVDDVKA